MSISFFSIRWYRREKEEEASQIYYKEADATVAKLKEQEPQELEDILLGISLVSIFPAVWRKIV